MLKCLRARKKCIIFAAQFRSRPRSDDGSGQIWLLATTQKNAKIACPDCYKAFHVYALEWEEDEYRLYVDDQLYFTFKNEGTGYEVWPYDKRFHILLNLAIGGNWGGQKGIDDSLFPHVFEIDYVRVYKK